MMKTDPSMKISIEGHTDNVGNAAANKTLSANRAKAVMDALVTKGIDKTRMSYTGWGQEKPVADNNTEEGKTKNRRVEIVKK
jgi:OmpA-OmpF porin, OOP family